MKNSTVILFLMCLLCISCSVENTDVDANPDTSDPTDPTDPTNPMSQARVFALILDTNDTFSVANYDHDTNVLSNSFSVAGDGFYEETTVYDANNNRILYANDTGISAVNVVDGLVTSRPFPFTATNGFGLALHYDTATMKVYALISDSDDNFSVAEYDFDSNTLLNTFPIPNDGAFEESTVYDSTNKRILYATDTGINAVNVLNGAVISRPFPFNTTDGYSLSLHFDETTNTIYALILDTDDIFTVAEYDYDSNTLSNIFTIANDGFYAESAVYNAVEKKIIYSNDTGINAVSVLDGSVTARPFPFPNTNGFSLSLLYGSINESAVDNPTEPVPSTDFLLKRTVTQDDSGEDYIINYIYDGNKLIGFNESDSFNVSYTYANDLLTREDAYIGNLQESYTIFEYDANNVLTEYIIYFTISGTTAIRNEITYLPNNEISTKSYYGDHTTQDTFSSETIDTYANGNWIQRRFIEDGDITNYLYDNKNGILKNIHQAAIFQLIGEPGEGSTNNIIDYDNGETRLEYVYNTNDYPESSVTYEEGNSTPVLSTQYFYE